MVIIPSVLQGVATKQCPAIPHATLCVGTPAGPDTDSNAIFLSADDEFRMQLVENDKPALSTCQFAGAFMENASS